MFLLNRFLKGALFLLVVALGQSHAEWQIEQLGGLGDGARIDIASDANGNAVAIASLNDTIRAFYYSRTLNSWTGPTILDSNDAFQGNPLVDMDPSGTALAIWENSGNTEIYSSFFNGTTWTTGSPDPFVIATGIIPSKNLDMNGPDTALAVWVDDGANFINSAFFSAGTWGALIPIAPSDGLQSSAAYSANGTAVAGFMDGTSLFVSNFIGGSWQTPVLLDAAVPFTNRNIMVSIDDLGNALAVWIDAAGDVRARTFNGTTWLAPVTISTVPGNVIDTLSLDMAPGGTAVVTWIDAAFTGQSSSYNGTSWSAPIPFSNDVREAEVSVNASGDALVIFSTTTNSLFSSRLPLGGVWTPVEPIFEGGPFDLNDINASLSDIGFGFAAWQAGGGGDVGDLQFAAVEIVAIPPSPPETIDGSICKNNFVTQTDRIHVITWTASSSLDVVSYNLSRNGVIIAVIPATDPFIYLDHNRCKKIADTYTLTAVNESGIESEPVTITLQ